MTEQNSAAEVIDPELAALLTDDVRAMVAALPDTTAGIRGRSIILLGFAAGRAAVSRLRAPGCSLSPMALDGITRPHASRRHALLRKPIPRHARC